MHKSAMEFCKRNIRDAKDKRILEIGAFDVNGTIRWHVEDQKPKIYIGTDIKKCKHESHNINNEWDTPIKFNWCGGCCSDLAIPIEELLYYFRPRTFDIVICTEVLEHVEDWQIAIRTIQDLTNSTGYMVITTRSPGFPYHEYPIDRWRFTKQNMEEIFYGRESVIENDPEAPGVFVKASGNLDLWDGIPLNNINVQELIIPG